MKSVFTFILALPLLFYNTFRSEAQCLANAGPDKALCPLWNDSTQVLLGENPTAQGGTPPYTYLWEAHHQVVNLNFYASDFLDDTTIANPILLTSPDYIEFYLTVTDSLGNVCKDTVIIRTSFFFINLTQSVHYYIALGDSVKFDMDPGVFSNYPPLTYNWHPGSSLTDSTELFTWAKPEVSTWYSLLVTDSLACSHNTGPFVNVHVGASGVANISDKQEYQIIPNPAHSNELIRITNPGSTAIALELFDPMGRLVKKLTTDQKETSLSTYDLKPNTYFYQISDNYSTVQRGVIIILR